jgi:hypothetical protein
MGLKTPFDRHGCVRSVECSGFVLANEEKEDDKGIGCDV